MKKNKTVITHISESQRLTGKNILIAAGGTAGHLFPAQQLAELLSNDQHTIVFGGHGLAKSPYFQADRFRFSEVRSSPFGRKFLAALLVGTWQSIRLLFKEKPDVVVGFGSYHTVPLLVASVLLRKKIVLYEANRSMGKVNRLFSFFAEKIAVQIVHKKNHVLVRSFPWILPQQVDKSSALQAYGLDLKKKTLLVFGGSQGAQFFNEMMPTIGWKGQVIHLAGNEQAAKQTAEKYAKAGICAVVKSFESNMALAYAAADFAVCRSGAGTIAELIRYGVPALLIPYPFAYGHQEINADHLSLVGGAKKLLQCDATAETIRQAIEESDPIAMRVALRSAEVQNQSLIGLDEVVRQCLHRSI